MDGSRRTDFLCALNVTHGDGVRGKILQRLLELSFVDVGFRLVDERISEGTDFDVAHRIETSLRYSFEARTSHGLCVPVSDSDLALMDNRGEEGYEPGLAALQMAPGARWVLVKRPLLRPPRVRISLGSSEGWGKLAGEVNGAFDCVVKRWGLLALRDGLSGLDSIIREAMRR
jgi:hypothetical protein